MTFSLKLNPAVDLPESELNDFREAVLDWARSVSRLESGALERQLELRAAQRVPVYDFSLQSLIETRDVFPEQVVQPYEEGMSTAERPLSHDKIKVWELSFEAPADFREFRASRLVPETLTVKDCVECRREGTTACEACNGEGRSACVECRGRGKKACESCHGLGKSNCLRCNGRGLKEGSKLLLSAEDACPGCKGDGKVVCARCEHGEMPCGFCESTGRRPCPKCDKAGRRQCSVCQGKGRIASGYSCTSEFKIVRHASVAAAAAVPASIINTLFGAPGPAAPVQTCDDTFTEEDVRGSALPEALKKELVQLSGKLKPFATQRSRPVRQRLTVGREDVVRIAGVFDGLELVCWLHPKSKKIVPETNPFQNLVGTAWEQAKKAADAGDWDNAVALANKTLTYDPAHAESHQLLGKRETLIFRSILFAAGAAGAGAAVLGALLIFLAEKGLHKAGPAFKAVLVLSILGPLIGLALYPFVKKFPKPKLRLGSTFGGTLAALILFSAVVRGVVGWDGVRNADEAAFRDEWKTKLPMGVSGVYWESDLAALRELEARYAKTRVDLTQVRQEIEKQERLKKEFDRLTAQFNQELRKILNAGPEMGLQEKILKLEGLQETYKIHAVDVSGASGPLAKMREQMRSAPSSSRRRSVLRIESSESVPAKAVAPKPSAKKATKTLSKKKTAKPSKAAASAKKDSKSKKAVKKETKKKKK